MDPSRHVRRALQNAHTPSRFPKHRRNNFLPSPGAWHPKFMTCSSKPGRVRRSMTVPGLAPPGDPPGLEGPMAPCPQASDIPRSPAHPLAAWARTFPWDGSRVEQTPEFLQGGANPAIPDLGRRPTGDRPPSSPSSPHAESASPPRAVVSATGARPAESEPFLGEQLNNSVTFYF